MDVIEPKLIGGLPPAETGPPFCVTPVAPEALMTTDGFLPCSAEPGVPFGTALAACEPPCPIALTPFTGDSVAVFAFCAAGAEAPAGVGGVCVAVLEASA